MTDFFNWCVTNDSVINLFLTVFSLLVAIVAIGISIFTLRKQIRLDVWDKRYEIYEPFVDITKKMKRLCEVADGKSYFALKNLVKAIMYTPIVDKEFDIMDKIIRIEKKMQSLKQENNSSEKEHQMLTQAIDELFQLDLIRFTKLDSTFSKARLLFPDNISKIIVDFWEVYGTFLLCHSIACETPEEYMELIFPLKKGLNEIDIDGAVTSIEKSMKIKA